MSHDFRDFLAWAIIIPLLLPFIIIGTVIGLNHPEIAVNAAFISIFCRPDFLIYSVALSGATYAELKNLRPGNDQINRHIWSISTILLICICVLSIAFYAIAYARSDFFIATSSYVIIVVLTLLTVFFGLLSWLCFNQERHLPEGNEANKKGS